MPETKAWVPMRVEECVTSVDVLPQPRFAGWWESIVTAPEVKERLLHGALLGLELRSKLPFTATALHGLLLLHGPPGTGKSTLAAGLAQEMAPYTQHGTVRLVQLNPHGLMSAEHGQSQQKVFELLCDYLPGLADDAMATIVLLDEVEAMTVARSAASLSANPADVHRATDAVLAALDKNAVDYPHLLTVATSNFPEALDDAFKSRADVAIEMRLPDADAIKAILRRTLGDFASAYPSCGALAEDPRLAQVAAALIGCDGRQVRKLVTEAIGLNLDTVLDPDTLSLDQLLEAAGDRDRMTTGDRGAAA